MANDKKRKAAPHNTKASFETLGRVPLNNPGDWIEAFFVGTSEVPDRNKKNETQKIHNFIGTLCVTPMDAEGNASGEQTERTGEFSLWGNMNLNNLLTEKRYGQTLVIECASRQKSKDGNRMFSTYRYSESLKNLDPNQ